jgi:hypothetical protein
MAYYSEKECEDGKKEFIISRVKADAKRAIGWKDERQFSAACDSITIKAQPK